MMPRGMSCMSEGMPAPSLSVPGLCPGTEGLSMEGPSHLLSRAAGQRRAKSD